MLSLLAKVADWLGLLNLWDTILSVIKPELTAHLIPSSFPETFEPWYELCMEPDLEKTIGASFNLAFPRLSNGECAVGKPLWRSQERHTPQLEDENGGEKGGKV